MSQRNIEVIQTKKTCVMTETWWYNPCINSLNSDPTQIVIKTNYKPGKNTEANLQAVTLPVYSSDTLSYAFISTHMYDLCVLLWWRFAANVDNLPYRDSFQSNLPATNNLSLFGRSGWNCYANTTKDNTWTLDSDCCVGETGPWRQNLRTGSACKTDTCLDTTSVGDKTQYTTVNIKKTGR